MTLGSYPVEIQGPSRRGGSSAVTGALLGRSCWQRGSQCRWPAPAIPAASAVQSRQTQVSDLGSLADWHPPPGSGGSRELGKGLRPPAPPPVARCPWAVVERPCTRGRRQPGARQRSRTVGLPSSPLRAQVQLDLCSLEQPDLHLPLTATPFVVSRWCQAQALSISTWVDQKGTGVHSDAQDVCGRARAEA